MQRLAPSARRAARAPRSTLGSLRLAGTDDGERPAVGDPMGDDGGGGSVPGDDGGNSVPGDDGGGDPTPGGRPPDGGGGGSVPGGGPPGEDGGDDGLLAGVGRRKLAAVAAAAVVVVAAAAGAVYVYRQSDRVDLSAVPAGVDSVAYTDVDRVSDDEAIERVVTKALSLTDFGAEDYADLKDRFADETGLSFEKLHAVVSYAKYDDSGLGAEYGGAVLRSDWATDDVVEAYEETTPYDYAEGDHEGTTVYRPAEAPANASAPWVGVLGGGTFVVGSPAAVEDAIATADGDADSVGGDLKQAFREARGGHTKFATAVPDELFDGELSFAGVNAGAYEAVEIVAGAYYTEDNTMGVELTMHADSEDAAADAAAVTRAALVVVKNRVGSDDLRSGLDDVEVEEDGERAVVSFENSVEDITELLEAVESETGGDDTSDRDVPVDDGAALAVRADGPATSDRTGGTR